MNPLQVYPWEPISCKPSQLIALMRKSRGQNLLMHFFYESYVYDAGVRVKDGNSMFFLDDDAYPSMLGFCSGACVEGVLISDFTDNVQVLAVNEEDPRNSLEGVETH